MKQKDYSILLNSPEDTEFLLYTSCVEDHQETPLVIRHCFEDGLEIPNLYFKDNKRTLFNPNDYGGLEGISLILVKSQNKTSTSI